MNNDDILLALENPYRGKQDGKYTSSMGVS